VFNALHLVDLVMIGLVLHLPKFMVFLLALFLVISVLPRDWLERASPIWPILCRVGR